MNGLKKKKLFWIIIAALAGALVVGTTVLASNFTQLQDWYRALGQTEAPPSNSVAGDSIYLQGENVVIYTSEVEQRTERYELFGIQNAKEEAVHSLLEREVFKRAATEAGYTISDTEAQDYLDEMITNIHKAENYADYQIYIEGTGMTEQEYWDSQFHLYRDQLLIEKYLSPIRENFYSQHQGQGQESVQALWQKERTRMADELIQKENVH